MSLDEEQKGYQARLAVLRTKPDNKSCIDCPASAPTWTTLTYGAFLCIDCAGHHRHMGVHLSFVRSSLMDKWTDDDVKRMEKGGNGKARAFWRQHGMENMKFQKYSTAAAKTYKTQLDRECGIGGAPKPAPPAPASPLPATSPAGLSGATPTSPTDSSASFTRSPSESTPTASPVAKSSNVPVTAAAISGSLGRKPVAKSTKKGLGGVKVAPGQKVTSGPIPVEAEKPSAPAATTASAPATSSNSSSASTAGVGGSRKPDYSGLGSDGQSGAKPVSYTASQANASKNYDRAGPDFGGYGAGGQVQQEQGVDIGDMVWKAGEALSKQKESLNKKVEAFSGYMKEILDDL